MILSAFYTKKQYMKVILTLTYHISLKLSPNHHIRFGSRQCQDNSGVTDGMESVLIVGGSSGIGEALARRMAGDGYEVGLTARRGDRLTEIARELPTKSYVAEMDVTEPDDAREVFDAMTEAMDGVDIVVLNAGIAPANPALAWEPDRDTIDTNVRGFVALATAALAHFDSRGTGHLVGISSVAAHLGLGAVPAYSASKAFVSNYLDGLRARTAETNITVTTIEPGYVDTDLSLGGFWECSPETAAKHIACAIETRQRHAFVPPRWRVIAWLLAVVPESIRHRFA